MAVRARVIDRDRGWNEYRRRVAGAKGAYVKVGVTSSVGSQPKESRDPAGKGPLTLVQVAWFNEFGTMTAKGKTHVPERSFIRSTHDEQREAIIRRKKGLVRQIGDGLSVRRALEILGTWMKGKIQAKIVSLRTPPNAPGTIKRKQSSNPLVDIGQLRQNIEYQVVVPKTGFGAEAT